MISPLYQWLVLLLIVLATSTVLAKWLLPKSWPIWARLWLAAVGSALSIFFIIWTIPYTDHYEAALANFTVSIAGRVSIGLGILMCGCFAHWFKQKDQLLYGQVEVLFGTLSVIGIATDLSAKDTLFSKWVALLGAAYVVARGLNNWSDALLKRPDTNRHRTVSEHIKSWFFREI